MKHIALGLSCLSLVLSGCAGSQSSSEAEAGPPAPDAASTSLHGLSVDRPEGWKFLPPDESTGKNTVVLLQGPIGEEDMAPAVEIERRPLNARQQRRKPSHLLTQLVTEMVQFFDGFEMKGQPEDLELGGRPAAKVRLTFQESLPDGMSVSRTAEFYGIVHDEQMWLIRCLGDTKGESQAQFDQIIASVKFDGAPES